MSYNLSNEDLDLGLDLASDMIPLALRFNDQILLQVLEAAAEGFMAHGIEAIETRFEPTDGRMRRIRDVWSSSPLSANFSFIPKKLNPKGPRFNRGTSRPAPEQKETAFSAAFAAAAKTANDRSVHLH